MPNLKAKLTKDEHTKLDASLQAFYTEKGGAFLLQVDGMVSQEDFDASEAKLAEFRDNNVALLKAAEKFKGVDPDEYKTLKTTVEKLGKAGITKPDEVETAIQAAVAKAINPLNDRLSRVEGERDAALRQVADKALDDALWEPAMKAGIRENARQAYLSLARGVFKYEDGKVVARDGEKPVYSKRRNNTTNGLTPEEWVTDPEWLLKEHDYLFKDSKGTGAQGNKGGSDSNGARVLQNDPMTLGANLEAMAKGGVLVQTGA